MEMQDWRCRKNHSFLHGSWIGLDRVPTPSLSCSFADINFYNFISNL